MNTRNNGIKIGKRLLALAFVLCAVASLAACGGKDGPWTFDLPNGYQVVREESQAVVFGKSGEEFNQMIGDRIIAFCYDDTYIGLKRVPLGSASAQAESYDEADVKYYLIDTVNNVQYGPYTKLEYDGQCDVLPNVDLGDWIKTAKRPKGAKD